MVSTAGERRHLTIVFCDLVNSTFLAEELDPEELRDLIGAYQQVCTTVVARLEGHVAQYLGDGVLIYFGFPNAHEDDPVRAVHAGLRIVEEMSSFAFPRAVGAPVRLSVRLGIHTGLVVAGEMGTRGRSEMLALGSAPNVAARLQTMAPANSIVVSSEVRRLTEGYFEFEELSARAQAGPRSIAGFRVLRAIPQTPFTFAAERGLTPFQGREGALDALRRSWAAASRAEGGIAVIRGEPGIGKSRLVHQFRATVIADGGRWIAGRGGPFKQAEAFWPLSEALRQLLDRQPRSGAEDWTEVLEQQLSELQIVDQDSLSHLAELLDVPVRRPPSISFTVDAQQSRKQTLEAVFNLLLRAAAQRPLVLCLEDLHWVDPSTLEFLEAFAPKLASARLLLVLTARPSFQWSMPLSEALCSLNLLALTSAEARAIVRHVCSTQGALSEAEADVIVARADGVPLFVEELTKSVLESRSGEESSARATGTSIPATLQDSLMARLDRLPLGRRVAQLAAVLGREFDASLVSSLGVFEASELAEGVEQLRAADLVSSLDGAGSYAFKHALIQDAAYESLLHRDRRDYHKRIAELLIARTTTADGQPELVAHHLSEALLGERALEYWLRAARRSLDRGANAEAQRYLARARAGFAGLADGPPRWECELQVEMLGAQVARATVGYASADVENSYTRALELCRQLADAGTGDIGTRMLVARVRCGEDFLTRSLAQNPRIGNRLFWVMWGFGAYHQSRAELLRALDIGNQLVELAGKEPALALEGHFGAGSTCYFMGRMSEARAHLEQGWECFETLNRIAETSPTGHHAEVLCAGYLALSLWHLDLREEADLQMQRAIDVARAAKHTYSVAYALTVAAWLAQMNGDRERAARLTAEVVALAKQFGFAFAMAWVMPICLWLEGTEPGGASDVAARFRAHLVSYQQNGYRVALTYFYGLLAEVLIARDCLFEADSLIHEALQLAEVSGERFWQSELYRLRGETFRQMQISEQLAARENRPVLAEPTRRSASHALEAREMMSLAKRTQS